VAVDLGAEGVISAERRVLGLRYWVPLFVLSVLYAAYTGFRVPNRWAATLYAVSLQEGFHRRFLVGTLLHPLAVALDYNYWLFAVTGFVVLALLIAVLAVAACRSPLVSQRFLVLAFLLLPTGGFLFDEVGYLDQLLYVFLFAALWMMRRSAWVVAPVVMTLAVFTHEIAILTVIPIYGFAALRERELDVRRTIGMLAPPIVAAIVVLSVPAIDSGAVGRFSATLHNVANFTPRADALDLFRRSQSESLQLYHPGDVFWFLVPLALIGAIGFLTLSLLDGRPRGGAVVYLVLAIGAIVAPVLLAFAGWDEWRWAFLLTANFFIVVWIWLGDRGRELTAFQWVALVFVLLVGLHSSLRYFDGAEPRSLRPSAIRELGREITDGTLFEIPKR
jgi:hypothetical protein